MRTLLVWLCLLFAAVATAADFTAVYVPKPGETPLPIPKEELRAEWRFERYWPPFRLIQGPQWDLVLVAGRPLTLAFSKNRPEHALFPGSEATYSVMEARRVSLWRDAEGRLRSLSLPPRPVGYPKGTLVCLGQYTSFLPFALYEDSAHLAIEDRVFLPFWLDALSLTLANPSEAPLSFDAGEFILWDTEDVFRLDGKLVRSPHRNATGEPHDLPRITLGPGEGKTFRWRVTGLAPGKLDRMLYVEAPILIDGEPACIFHTEIPLLDLSGEFLFFDPLPPDNCELLQERERVEPARFPRKVLFEKRIPGHDGVSALGVSDPCPAERPRGRV